MNNNQRTNSKASNTSNHRICNKTPNMVIIMIKVMNKIINMDNNNKTKRWAMEIW